MIKSKIKILFVGPFPDPITGNSIANLTAYNGFKEKGYSVDLINSSLSFFDENVGVFSLKKVVSSIKFNFQVYKVLSSSIIYITPGQTFFGILKYSLIILFAKVFRKKIVIHIHGNYLRRTFENLKYFKLKIIKKILGSADRGIVLSESLKPNLLPVLDKSKIHVVNNFVENYLLENTGSLVAKKKIEEIRIVFLSNLMREKGIINLLQALKILNKEKIKYKAKIAGNIDVLLKEKIRGLFDELPNVEYLGIVKGEIKKQMLLWGNIFVFPTYYKMEGQPISILEAMATGNIILTTNHAGIPDIFSEDNGLFIQKKSSIDIVNKIKEVALNKQYFNNMILKNHKYVINNFSRKKYILNLEKVLGELIY